ncbi:MAG: carboxypeptidase-like regulatory domain-containing protein, partial [Clostridiales bacterium]|nr:carboxypeptidase-like regulatory domain-containing protein [Clostridiales bacterium]
MKVLPRDRLLIASVSILMLLPVFFSGVDGLAQEQMGKGRISGTVVDDAGNPVEGAVITVESLSTET